MPQEYSQPDTDHGKFNMTEDPVSSTNEWHEKGGVRGSWY